MKKLLTLLLAFALMLSAVACGDSTVDITLSASLFTDDISTFNTQDFIDENGYKAATVNQEEQTITITMTKAKHDEIMKEMNAAVLEVFDELIGGDATPYIKNITYTDGFKVVTVDVDAGEYAVTFLDMTPLTIGVTVRMYQNYSGLDDGGVEIIIRDADTQDEIKTVEY